MFSKASQIYEKNCQRHPTNLLAKQLKTTTPRLHATYPITELSNVSEEVIKQILLSLDTSRGPGMYQIPLKFLREGEEVSALPLRNINLSIKLSTFPQECKIAKLKVIFKKGCKDWS